MKINCPKCNKPYVKGLSDKSYHCSDIFCDLFWHEHKENPWPNIWRIIRYSTAKDFYYGARNLLFKRYDLIRTGFAKNHWCDKDYLMLHGMMGMLVDYIESECTESTCKVKISLDYTVYGVLPGVKAYKDTQTIDESWVLVDGTWYLVPE